ncbi:phosphodiester glycosidase family protein [uncultured Dokdonia sp.]|uniref:phosphodiester glycosidase family protein n=1 Tax=uncultured Dokdonia sp. TaxID=575653 RepID=UPI0026133D1B|nr:phosphodiester glycosidase family protein [uncultured Dokdonia sp.]
MRFYKIILSLCLLVVFISFSPIPFQSAQKDTNILSYEVNLNTQQLDFYWKNAQGKNYESLQNLKTSIEKEGKELVFAMNGGMYQKDRSPQGLYIEKGSTKAPINTQKGDHTNFFLHPNGIFYITKNNKATICTTPDFKASPDIQYATQSGPMLLIDGKIHPKFNEGSPNVHIRNAVGILPNGNPLFAMSKEQINFYDLACFFKEKGCKNALYLDGFVSRTYLPSRYWEQLDGNFGVIIGVTRDRK